MPHLVGRCASQAVCVSWTVVQLLQSPSDFRGKPDVFDSYMQSSPLESLPKIPSVVTAWVSIYCVLPKDMLLVVSCQ